MEPASSTAWPQTVRNDPMVSAPEDDFTSFLDLGNFQLDLSSFDPISDGPHLPSATGTGIDSSHDAMQDITGHPDMLSRQPQQQQQQQQQRQHRPRQPQVQQIPPAHPMDRPQSSSEALMDIHLQAQLFEQQQMQRLQGQRYPHQHAIIPPTPNSIETRGGVAKYYPHMDAQSQALIDQYNRIKDDQMIFTPLVSPAVTPLDAQFAIPEYTVPGAYMSPLTSPALEAQHHSSHRNTYAHITRSDTSTTTSPIDLTFGSPNLNVTSAAASASAQRKPKRRMSAARTPARVVRQSPSMKPQRRKAPSNCVVPSKELIDLAQQVDPSSAQSKLSGQTPGGAQMMRNQDSSEAESISPEPLSEGLMAPPPAPRSGSASDSPYLAAATKGSPIASNSPQPVVGMNADGLHPATPASLMRIQKPPKQARTSDSAHGPSKLHDLESQAGQDQPMLDLELPEAADDGRPPLARIDTQHTDDQTTPTLSAKKTPKLTPVNGSGASTPISRGREGAASAVASPGGSTSAKRPDGKAFARGAKKRNSTSSVQVSPALRPKISPSIKPLLAEGAVSAETSALLLASKSNYQNILEGNHLPGVSYPEALSTNLTSKRTSHKIAEQGRRNRINSALQEIASLLPASSGRDSSSSGGEAGVTAANKETAQGNSKASTVEMAIDYIKALQNELKETKGRLEVVEKELQAKESFDHIYLDLSKQPGKCRFADNGLGWRPSGGGDTFTLDHSNIAAAQWSRAARGQELKILSRTSGVVQLDGFLPEDYERLSKCFKLWYSVNLEQKEHALRGWNWGKSDFGKSELAFSVQNKPAFEIPYSEISNTNLAGKNEVALEFSLPANGDDTGTNGALGGARARGKKAGGARDQLVEMRFYIPGTIRREPTEDGGEKDANGDEYQEEQNAAGVFYETLMEKAEIGEVAGDTFATFADVLHLTPRGRFDIDLYESSFRLRGKTYDYKIQYDSIKKFMLLPKPDELHCLITIGLDPPLRQGQTRYPFIVMQFKSDEEVEIDLNMTEDLLKDKYEGKLQSHYGAETHKVVAQVFRGLAGKKIFLYPSQVDALMRNMEISEREDVARRLKDKDKENQPLTCVPDVSSFHHAKGVKCSIKANEGHLFCLDKSFMFVPKPATYISFENIASITMSRVGGAISASRTFDITITLKGGAGEHQFSNINREEQTPLEDFFKVKNLRTKNEMTEDSSALIAAALKDEDMASSEDEVIAARRGSDDDEESVDEDFHASSDSDPAEEYDSAHESSGGSGDEDEEMGDAEADDKVVVEDDGVDDGDGGDDNSGDGDEGDGEEKKRPTKKVKVGK
ncbi:MAG: FACT complex subunit [Caeruleum heppii]|nr:MAG: FACT complex subunit [Caeruleum heppii]